MKWNSKDYMSCPTKCNIPKDIISTSGNKIIVIGDLHADYSKTIIMLKYFKLINELNQWIGGNTILVQLGDQIDGKGRGGSENAQGELKLLEFFDNLHLQAQLSNGAVYSLLGNHEIMNTVGRFDYVSVEDISDFGGEDNRLLAFNPSKDDNKGCLSKRFACTRNVFLKINDILFVHAGIVPELVREHRGNTISFINNLMRKYLNGNIDRHDAQIKKYFENSNSVLWNRSLGKDNINCEDVDEILKELNAKHIIIGHTPQSIINQKCNNKVWRVDVGLSKSLGDNNFQVLEITKKNNSYNFQVLS